MAIDESKDETEQTFIRIKIVLKTKVNVRNTIQATNSNAIPVNSYSAGVIIWSNNSAIRQEKETEIEHI